MMRVTTTDDLAENKPATVFSETDNRDAENALWRVSSDHLLPDQCSSLHYLYSNALKRCGTQVFRVGPSVLLNGTPQAVAL